MLDREGLVWGDAVQGLDGSSTEDFELLGGRVVVGVGYDHIHVRTLWKTMTLSTAITNASLLSSATDSLTNDG